jgi:hypothetical protein
MVMENKPVEDIYPHYAEWLRVYDDAKEFCAFPQVLEFLAAHPEAVNNRKGGVQGCTFLHQAGFWGADRGILEQLRNFGADPSLVDLKERSAADMATENGNGPAAALVREVFNQGDHARTEEELHGILEKAHNDPATFAEQISSFNDAELRLVFYSACKCGHWCEAVRLLTCHRWLAVHQAVGGWSMVHQAVYHDVGKGMLRRLRELGGLAGLLNTKGETARELIAEYHPDSGIATAFDQVFSAGGADGAGGGGGIFAASGALVEGDVVALSRAAGPSITGAITKLHNGEVTVLTAAGEEETGGAWRASRVRDALADADAGDDALVALLTECCGCGAPCLAQKLTPTCAEHDYCSDCLANSLFVSFTDLCMDKPAMQCQWCKEEITDLEMLNSRGLNAAWARKHPDLTLRQFRANVEEKKATVLKGRPVRYVDLDPITKKFLDDEIAKGELMLCLGQDGECQAAFSKDDGCNFVRCWHCNTEHCFGTKKLAGCDGRPAKSWREGQMCGGGHACHY